MKVGKKTRRQPGYRIRITAWITSDKADLDKQSEVLNTVKAAKTGDLAAIGGLLAVATDITVEATATSREVEIPPAAPTPPVDPTAPTQQPTT